VLASVESFLNREQVLNCVKEVPVVVEDATDEVDRHCAFVIVLLARHTAASVLEQEQVVIQGLETLIAVLLALCAEFANKLQELEVAVDGKVFALKDSVEARLVELRDIVLVKL